MGLGQHSGTPRMGGVPSVSPENKTRKGYYAGGWPAKKGKFHHNPTGHGKMRACPIALAAETSRSVPRIKAKIGVRETCRLKAQQNGVTDWT